MSMDGDTQPWPESLWVALTADASNYALCLHTRGDGPNGVTSEAASPWSTSSGEGRSSPTLKHQQEGTATPEMVQAAVEGLSRVGRLFNLVSSPSSAHLSLPQSLSVPPLRCHAEPKEPIPGQDDDS